ncbi:hypothetical protein BST97_04445 [Nonlabens spongiae]|uniref:Uncharacterized protein n=1 Tax=Nonlabens spongiae TaxID=331648 RepID=A0A1W6MI74_9FLAO|nr:hypothetical protein BST97_04445 [Nonlabens spongiae]
MPRDIVEINNPVILLMTKGRWSPEPTPARNEDFEYYELMAHEEVSIQLMQKPLKITRVQYSFCRVYEPERNILPRK